MASKWRSTRFADFAEIRSGGTPSTATSEYWTPEIDWVTAKDITECPTYKIWSTEKRISKRGLENSPAQVLPELTTVLIARGATTGGCRLLSKPMAMNQTCYGLVARPGNDPYFLYYWLTNTYKQIRALAHGTVFETVIGDTLRSLEVNLPPSTEQRAIAHILGTLDDKIELNRRMNETLEAMARVLFKSWFVNFDPVRAKAEGRDPGLPKVMAALFPDSFEDLELGEIPKRWKTGTLADYAELNPETWSKTTAPDEIEYVDLANTKWGKIEETQRYLWKDAPSRAQRILRPGDTIIGMVRPGNGSFSLVAQEGLTGSTGFAVLRPRKAVYEEYIYLAASSPDNVERLAHLADGAAYPAVRPDVVLATRIVLPRESLLECFASAVKPIMDKIAANEYASQTLAALRDILLPKLISGELRVKDALKAKEAQA